MSPEQAVAALGRLIENIERVIFGKREAVEMCVIGLVGRGHLLIEDVPGIGKTTLAQSLARSINCRFSRIQFTSDMLPSDIIGVSVLNPHTNDFEFRPGPVFAGVVLADEINRTPPKSQSALLEAMSDYQVSVDGATYPLPEPFIVMATQNPIEYEGTYSLPEAELDRFMLRVEIGYPNEGHELRIMRRRDPKQALSRLEPVLHVEEVLALQELAAKIQTEESVVRYMRRIVQGTREDEFVELGASPRAAVSFYQACQACALLRGRTFVTPDDVRRMALPALSHRIIVKSRSGNLLAGARSRAAVVTDIIKRTPVPE